MSASLPPREAIPALLLAVMLAATVVLARGAGAGPLGACAAVACAGAALLGPALGVERFRWGLPALLIGLPILCTVAYGHTLSELGGCVLLFALCTAAGALESSPEGGVYLPVMLLIFAAPYALAYLVEEFGNLERVAFWRTLSPFAAAQDVAAGRALPPVCLLLLMAGPVWTLLGRRR